MSDSNDRSRTIQEAARYCLEKEIQSLKGLADSFDADFCAVVERLFEGQGRVVVTGIGKSALVGQKIVATLNSTGSPALFMHAADAIHGDLGMIQQNDSVICISKSGETNEIKALIPVLQRKGNLLIGMVSQRESTLARQSDLILFTPVDMEAEPNNLAPTASTAAQMAMGDALAVSLLALRGFKSEDFALLHPGGSLGKQLSLRVSYFIDRHPKPAVAKEDPLAAVISAMTSGRLGAVAVTDSSGGCLGIITDGDLRRMLADDNPNLRITASQLMSPDPKKIEQGELAVEALAMLKKYEINQLIVTDENKIYMGMIHIHDLLKEGLF